jgi:AraC family transcriptional regulator, melibiose operon regulatory protein
LLPSQLTEWVAEKHDRVYDNSTGASPSIRTHRFPKEGRRSRLRVISDTMVTFDPSRPSFEPYGFTCQRWTPVPMRRADRHNEIELNLLRRGSLTYLMGGTTVTIPAGRLAVFWAAIPHQIVSSRDNAEYFVATIPLVWFLQCQFPKHFVDIVMHTRMVLDPDPQARHGDMEMFERWVHDLEKTDPVRQRVVFLEIEARLLRFALAVPPESPSGRRRSQEKSMIETGGLKRVEQMAYFVAQHYAEPLTAQQISSVVGLHPNYAMSLFKKAMGITLIDCVTQHRVSHAQRLLATTDVKIIDVALSSGFSSLSRFYEAFKTLCGCTPKDYRHSHGPTEPPSPGQRKRPTDD